MPEYYVQVKIHDAKKIIELFQEIEGMVQYTKLPKQIKEKIQDNLIDIKTLWQNAVKLKNNINKNV